MKRLLSLLLLLAMAGVQRSMAQIASFSFASQSTASGWTNLAGDPHSGAQTATANGITISSISASNWVPNGVPSNVYDYGGASGATYFPQVVMTDTWLQWNGTNDNLALYNAAIPQLELSGLNPDSTYTLRMSGSDVYYTGSTQYTVAGASVGGSQYLNTYNNATQGVTFLHIQPDSNGHIWVYVNATSTATFAFISGLQVYSGSANIGAPVVALTAPANGTVQSEGGNFIITATASETGSTIAKVEFYADTTKIGEADATPYTMTWVDPDPGNYQITAKATDAIGTISTATVNVGVQSLNYFWSTTGNIATNGDSSFVGTVDTNRLSFRTNNVERMTILKDGTIGIGTKVTDGYQLAVNGTAIFVKIKVKPLANWPDFVFGDTYKLPPLDSLEYYIRQYHHLPGILPEQEERHEGVDVAEQQAALLKKLEENTLYLIDQNKRLKAMAIRLADLDRQVRSLKRKNLHLTKALENRSH
ncbi:MAG TPA: Ig-like domain-containing protein [Puia sp.]|nr:Ig-like domain-containing protein [Puia sp.]